MNLSISVETITPDQAKNYLNFQKCLINKDSRRVRDYAYRMARREWKIAQPIIFDEEGYLIDGYHRLSAVIIFNHPIVFSVLRGIPSASRDVIDTGKPRTPTQIFEILADGGENTGKVENSAQAISVVRATAAIGNLPYRSEYQHLDRKGKFNIGDKVGIQSPQAYYLLANHYAEGIKFAIRLIGSKEENKIVGSCSLIKAVFFRAYYFYKESEKIIKLEEFMEYFYTGKPELKNNDSRKIFRDFFIDCKNGVSGTPLNNKGFYNIHQKCEAAIINYVNNVFEEELKISGYEEFPMPDFDFPVNKR